MHAAIVRVSLLSVTGWLLALVVDDRYDVWRNRVRGGDDPNASDSEPDDTLTPEENDADFINVLSALPDECTIKSAHITSGHSQDVLRILIEGLKPGTCHRFKVRARNNRGFSDWTGISNTWRSAGACNTFIRV